MTAWLGGFVEICNALALRVRGGFELVRPVQMEMGRGEWEVMGIWESVDGGMMYVSVGDVQ